MGEQATSATDQAGRWLRRDRDRGRDAAERAVVSELLAGIRDRVLAAAQLRPGQQVLDLGAGTGLLTYPAGQAVTPGGTVTALDLSPSALAHNATARRVAGDACRLPLRDDCVDRVVVRSVLIYLADLTAGLREVARVLKHGGILSLFEPVNARRHHDAHLERHGLTAVQLAAVHELRGRGSSVAAPMLAFDTSALISAAVRADLTITSLEEATITDQLTSHQQVDAYLNRRPHPGAESPTSLITAHLGAGVAARHAAAWHGALDDAGPGGITFTTPVLYATARSP